MKLKNEKCISSFELNCIDLGAGSCSKIHCGERVLSTRVLSSVRVLGGEAFAESWRVFPDIVVRGVVR